MAAPRAHWVLVLALTGVLHQLCLCQEADEVVVAAQSEGAEAQLLAAGAVLLDGQGLLDTTADAQLTSPVTLVEPAAAAAVCVPTKNKNYCAVMCPNGGCITDLTASMSAQVAAVGGRVRGKPDRPGADDPPPLGTAPPVVCDVGSTPISGTKMKYTPDDKRFIQTDFYHSCLGNAAVGCDDKANTADPANMKSVSSCCSCFLYSAFFDPKHSSQYIKFQTSGKNFYKNAAKLDPANNRWHLLVMPADPCPGVEHWSNPSTVKSCPGEDIWTAADNVIRDSRLWDVDLWGMAINPVSRRGQHQMHIHVAPVYHNLIATIYQAVFMTTTPPTTFWLNCGTLGSTTKLKNCNSFATSSKEGYPKVTIKLGTPANTMFSPGKAEPFATVYPTNMLNNKNKDNAVLKTSTLVLPLTWGPHGGWAIIENPNGPAECFFDPHTDDDLDKACKPSS